MIQVKIKWTKTSRAFAFILVLLVLGGVFYLGYDKGTVDLEEITQEMIDLRKRDAKRDSMLVAANAAMEDMRYELDSLRKYKVVTRQETDSTLVIMKKLTKVEVTPETINEALLWIEEHNKSLQP